jgi:hypothetical protein
VKRHASVKSDVHFAATQPQFSRDCVRLDDSAGLRSPTADENSILLDAPTLAQSPY